VVLILAAAGWAGDFWREKPASAWTDEEALKVVRDSPWAKEEHIVQPPFTVTAGTGISTQSGERRGRSRRDADLPPLPPEMERPPDPNRPPPLPRREDFTQASYLVRWESSGTVRAAFERLRELGMEASAEFQAPAPRLPDDRYVVTVKVTRPAQPGPDLFDGMDLGTLLDRARLKTRRGEVEPMEVERSGKGASAAVHFLFPREVKGRPLLESEKERVEFEFEGEQLTLKSKFEIQRDDVR